MLGLSTAFFVLALVCSSLACTVSGHYTNDCGSAALAGWIIAVIIVSIVIPIIVVVVIVVLCCCVCVRAAQPSGHAGVVHQPAVVVAAPSPQVVYAQPAYGQPAYGQPVYVAQQQPMPQYYAPEPQQYVAPGKNNF